MKKVLFISIAVVLALGVGLMGCDGTTPPTELECNEDPAISVLCNAAGYPTDPDQCVVEGNTLKVLHPDAPANLGCPWEFSSGFETPQSDFAIERLLGLNENAELCAQLATSWVNDPDDGDDGSITFTLRQGVTFHDGSAFNATSCKWNLDLQAGITDPKAGIRDIKGFVDSVEVTGDYEVKVWMSEWVEDFDRYFMSTGAGRMVSMVSAMANNQWSFPNKNQWCKENPIGTGPFEFVSYDGSSLLVYDKYDDYWQEGLPYLDSVEIHYVPNEMTRLFAFQSGDYHVMNDMSTSTAAELIGAGYVVTSRVVNIEGLGPDSLEPPFDDQDMREMLAMAVDYEPLVDSLCNGMFEYTNQLALESVEDLGLASGWNASMVGYPYDQDGAKAILESKGYNTTPLHGGWGSPTNPGPIFEIDMVYATQAATDFLLGVQTAFWEIGVEMNLIYMERSPWSELCGDGWDDLVEYQFSYNCFELTYDQSLTMGLSDGMDKYASILIPGDYDALYDAMMVETDDATKENMFVQLNTMAIDKYCLVIPYFGYEIMSGRQTTVRDFGYGVASSEWCPEYGWLYEDQS